MAIDHFSELALHALGDCYVYGLIDPRTGRFFYIGKGTGDRVFAHEFESMKDPDSEKLKLKTIKEIKDAGLEIKKVIISCGMKANEAFAAEAALINAFNFVENTGLTNAQSGHHSDRAYDAEVFEHLFGAEKLTNADIRHHLFLIPVDQLYRVGMSAAETYEVVRGCWTAGRHHFDMKRLKKVEYVLGVYHGLVVAVYRPTYWAYVKDDPDGVPARDKGKTDILERCFFRDAVFEQGGPMDAVQESYLYRSVVGVTKPRSKQHPMYLDPK